MNQHYYSDIYSERLCIRIIDGKESEEWAKQEMRKEIIDLMIADGLPAILAGRWAKEARDRAINQGILEPLE